MARRKMIAKTQYNHKTRTSDGTSIEFNVDLSRFERQYERAQYALDSVVMASMKPYMPQNTGTFINITSAQSAALAGTGKVVAAAAPMGRYLYEGKVMVDEQTGSPWARPGARKVVTDKDLQYSNPKATPHWFDTAKQKNGKSWIRAVKRIAGGG